MKVSLLSSDLAKLRAFDGWQAVLQQYLFNATQDNIDDIEVYAQGYMYSTFKDPQGPLENNFTQDKAVSGRTVTGQLINDSPYAWRREEGFSGKTDSRGRFYQNDPGIHYMSETLLDKTPDIFTRYQQAISDALAELSGGSNA